MYSISIENGSQFHVWEKKNVWDFKILRGLPLVSNAAVLAEVLWNVAVNNVAVWNIAMLNVAVLIIRVGNIQVWNVAILFTKDFEKNHPCHKVELILFHYINL